MELFEVIASRAQIVGPAVSVAGAFVSFYWARKRLRWDAAKELGPLRAETIALLRSALLISNPSWRRVPMSRWIELRLAWDSHIAERAPVLGRRAYRQMRNLSQLLGTAETEVYEGVRMFIGSESDPEPDPKQMSERTYAALEYLLEKIEADRFFFAR